MERGIAQKYKYWRSCGYKSTSTDAATLCQGWIESVSTKVAILLTRLRTLGFFNKLPVNEVKNA